MMTHVDILLHQYTASQPSEDGDRKVLQKCWHLTATLHDVITQWRWRKQDYPKSWHPATTLHGDKTNKDGGSKVLRDIILP